MPQLQSPISRSVRRGVAVALVGLAAAAPSALAAAPTGGAEAGGDGVARSTTSASPRATSASGVVVTRTVIRKVQRKLRRKPDGIYGKRTRAAVRRWQARKHLPVDGKLGPRTLKSLGIAAPARDLPAAPAKAAKLLELIAACESGGDPTAVSPGGKYRGKYQFLRSTWSALGGSGDPAKAPESEQDQRAGALLAQQGTAPWPECGRRAQAAVQGDA